jgi:hypothetical protein
MESTVNVAAAKRDEVEQERAEILKKQQEFEEYKLKQKAK